MTSFWSAWIISLTTITIIALFWILWANRKEEGGQETTGHVFDGIEEYNNPLPAWWLGFFVMTLVFGIGYLIAYPGMGNFPGLLNWTQVGQYESEVKRAAEKYEPLFEEYAAVAIPELANITKAMRMGQRIFANSCAQCHGSDGRGAYGFPNLADKDWLYGGTPEAILATITNGRTGAMPSWSAALQEDQIKAVIDFIPTLSAEGTTVNSEAGKKVFNTYCFACHGADGRGNQLLGAPNLTDAAWLYGSAPDQLRETIMEGRNGIMPAHNQLLPKSRIHLLAAYVYSLANQE